MQLLPKLLDFSGPCIIRQEPVSVKNLVMSYTWLTATLRKHQTWPHKLMCLREMPLCCFPACLPIACACTGRSLVAGNAAAALGHKSEESDLWVVNAAWALQWLQGRECGRQLQSSSQIEHLIRPCCWTGRPGPSSAAVMVLKCCVHPALCRIPSQSWSKQVHMPGFGRGCSLDAQRVLMGVSGQAGGSPHIMAPAHSLHTRLNLGSVMPSRALLGSMHPANAIWLQRPKPLALSSCQAARSDNET